MPTQTLTNSGTWTVPPQVFSVVVQGIGDGGGGGGGGTGPQTGGTGGGGGASVTSTISVVPGSVLSYNIGTGGAGGAVNANGSPGTGVWFSTPTTVYAPGGGAGSTGAFSAPGGVGGQASACIGGTAYSGGSGANQIPSQIASGTGAGSSAGVYAPGNNGTATTGGTAPAGGGNGGNNGTTFEGPTAGTAPGGGGGGAAENGTHTAGAAGAAGLIVLTWNPVTIPVQTFNVILDPSNPIPYNAPITIPQSATPQIAWVMTDVNLNPINLIGCLVEFVVWSSPENTLFEADSGSIGGIVIGGEGSNVITLSLLAFDTGDVLPDGANYTLWLNAPAQTIVIAQGAFSVTPTQLLTLVS